MDHKEDNQISHLKHIVMTPFERDRIIDTGAYNSYIKGYMLYALETIEADPGRIREATAALSKILDTTSAREAREKATV